MSDYKKQLETSIKTEVLDLVLTSDGLLDKMNITKLLTLCANLSQVLEEEKRISSLNFLDPLSSDLSSVQFEQFDQFENEQYAIYDRINSLRK